MKLLRALLDRLDEPTSWAAIGAMLALFGVNVDAELWGATVNAAIAISGLLLVLIPTKKAEQKIADAVDRRLPERLRRDRYDDVPDDPDRDPARRVRDSKESERHFGVGGVD